MVRLCPGETKRKLENRPARMEHAGSTTRQKMKREGDYIPALRYRWLTRFYDPIVRATTRESAFKRELVEQAHLQHEHRILDLGCGTGTLAIMIKDSCPGAEVVGIDGDAEVLAIARTKVALTGVAVQFDRGVRSEER